MEMGKWKERVNDRLKKMHRSLRSDCFSQCIEWRVARLRCLFIFRCSCLDHKALGTGQLFRHVVVKSQAFSHLKAKLVLIGTWHNSVNHSRQ